ncbi:hypothetical protein G647_03980 [Cladophialophora carrionii CBS 160.54]|uniref:Uncharacterized protein n=1 Tax=Cladophialophora carrionii CBS 160.54 TaxID=1279043 RepID=V9DD46_9EURO|nr:uncharacterized protein G647_03980 [Cladophialophora carrionii CBS 160.54]ETI24611.1 hypothetical protein G647_03980 [Cladophialophora carrionii CBS 160.54]
MTKRAIWTPRKLEKLYEALDEIAETGSGVTPWPEAFELMHEKTGLSKVQVSDKLRGLGQKHNLKLNREELVRRWAEVSVNFNQATSRASHSYTQSPKSDNNPNPPKHTHDQLYGAASNEVQGNGEQHNDSSREADAPTNSGCDNHADNNENNNDAEEPVMMLEIAPYEWDMIHAWRDFMHGKRFLSPMSREDVSRELSHTWRLLIEGIKSFCKAQPIAHLTTAKLSRPTLELARTFTTGYRRPDVDECLNTLFGDPALNVPLILRAFAAAAITTWVFADFPSYRPPPTGSALAHCLKVLAHFNSHAARDTEEAMEVEYFDNVIAPTLPQLAKQYRHDLFVGFSNLRVPLERHFYPQENQNAENAPDFAFRKQQHSDWAAHIEKAFLVALKLRLELAKSKSVWEFNFIRQGQKLEDNLMVPMVSKAEKPTPKNLVLQCLSPATSYYQRGERGHTGSKCLHVYAKVIVEGLAVNEAALLGSANPNEDKL